MSWCSSPSNARNVHHKCGFEVSLLQLRVFLIGEASVISSFLNSVRVSGLLALYL